MGKLSSKEVSDAIEIWKENRSDAKHEGDVECSKCLNILQTDQEKMIKICFQCAHEIYAGLHKEALANEKIIEEDLSAYKTHKKLENEELSAKKVFLLNKIENHSLVRVQFGYNNVIDCFPKEIIGGVSLSYVTYPYFENGIIPIKKIGDIREIKKETEKREIEKKLKKS